MKFKQRVLNKVRPTHSKSIGGVWIVIKKETKQKVNIMAGGIIVGMGILLITSGVRAGNEVGWLTGIFYIFLGGTISYIGGFKEK